MVSIIDGFSPLDHSRAYYSQGIKAKHSIPEARAIVQDVSGSHHSPASIGYHPSLQQYIARASIKATACAAKAPLPDGWPASMTGLLAWQPSDFADEAPFVYTLSELEKEEIDTALGKFKKLHSPVSDAGRANFPLPTLGDRLTTLQKRVYDGPGLVIIRGLNADKYDDVDAATVFLGVSSYMAERRGKQDRKGSMISHVLSHFQTHKNDDKNTLEMPFHTDIVCDMLALFTRNCSAAGGRGTVASSWTVYNELAKQRPDLIKVLAEPNWPLDIFGRDPAFHNQALLYHADGKVILSVSRRLLTGSPETPRSKDIPSLSEQQAEALDAVHFLAKANSIRISMQKGDMRFLNNLALVHSREAFEDTAVEQRHLLRLWLNNTDKVWKLPTALELAWDRVFDDDDRPTVWDYSPVMVEGVLHNPAESCD